MTPIRIVLDSDVPEGYASNRFEFRPRVKTRHHMAIRRGSMHASRFVDGEADAPLMCQPGSTATSRLA